MAKVTVQPLPRAYRWRNADGRMEDYGKGDTSIPEEMAKSLHTQGLIPVYEGYSKTKTPESPVPQTDEIASIADEELPEDFPGRKQFIAAGFTTVKAVQNLSTFEGIEGVGQATAAKVQEYLGASK